MARTRYSFGGSTTTTSVGTGVWTRRDMPRQSDDIFVTLTDRTRTHLNIITYKLYGDDSLGWLVLQYNNIIDPVAEMYAGKIIAMPHPNRIK